MDAIIDDIPEDEKISYDISCHCGDIQGTVKLRPLEQQRIYSDNCSICTKNGYLLAFALRDDYVWQEGYDKLKTYRWGSKTKDHRFCSNCGSSMILDLNGTQARDLVGINVRMLKDIELKKLIFFDMNNKEDQ